MQRPLNHAFILLSGCSPQLVLPCRVYMHHSSTTMQIVRHVRAVKMCVLMCSQESGPSGTGAPSLLSHQQAWRSSRHACRWCMSIHPCSRAFTAVTYQEHLDAQHLLAKKMMDTLRENLLANACRMIVNGSWFGTKSG